MNDRVSSQPSPDGVLVVGATGRTGRLLVALLVEQGLKVSALVRDPARARQVLAQNVRLVVGDLAEAKTLAPAVDGVGAIVVLACGVASADNSPLVVDFQGTGHLLEAARAARVELVIYVSSIHVTRPEHQMDLEPTSLGWKGRAEDLVRRSGIAYCIVRAGWLTDRPGGDALVLAQGDTSDGHLSRADLARVCADVLSRPEALGKTFEVVSTRSAICSTEQLAVDGLQLDGAATA